MTGLLGQALPRPGIRRLAAGRGTYTDDLTLPRMVHVAFVRSLYAHARILSIDCTAAKAAPGVVAVVTGAELAPLCTPWAGTLAMLPDFRPPLQYPLAVDETAWQGEAVVAVVAGSRAQAEDAAELVEIDWRELPAVADPVAALAPGAPTAPTAHSSLASNLAATIALGGDVAAAFGGAALVVEHDFEFGRQTGVPLEPRVLLADFDPAEGRLTVYQSHQSPWQMQDVLARTLGLAENKVRVIARDVGGAFGVKLHAYPDEVAAAALAVMLGRPVKFAADRLESFVSDVHAREARVKGRLAVDGDGRILAFEVDVLSGIGPYSTYPRSSLGEGMQAVQMIGAPYRVPAYAGRLRVAWQNKAPTGAIRAVGQPIACTVTEQLLDLAAAGLGLDPAEIRGRNHLAAADLPRRSPGGVMLADLSPQACLDAVLAGMDYDGLRRDQEAARGRGVYRGIGLASFVEITAVGAGLYGPAGVRVSAHESCTVRLEPSGTVRCQVTATDQGQGILAGIGQVVADTLGVAPDAVTVEAGDSGAGLYGGGAWASRGMAIGGQAARDAAGALRDRILAAAGAVLQADPATLRLAAGSIRDRDGCERMALAELSALVHFRQDTLPPGVDWSLSATRSHLPDQPYLTANGVQACHLELDAETGLIRILGFWVAEDCGRVVNPLLVDSQLRGGIVQGLGAALYEHCLYDGAGQLLNGTLADYLLPAAPEMPDIGVFHVEGRAGGGSGLGAKGVGEAGALAAPAAVWCALNDALRPLGAKVWKQPFTPAHVMAALAQGGKS